MMIDIHTHILPEVDDGSSSFEMSYEMLNLELLNNVDVVVLTPHYFITSFDKIDKEKLKEKFEEFKEKFSNFGIRFVLGAELYYTPELMHEINNHQVITLGDSNYILIEFSLVQNLYDIPSILNEIVYLGYRPILAHPERYAYLNEKDIIKIKQTGTLIQVNTSSILGDFGRDIQKKAFRYIKLNLVDFISSDAHETKIRKPNLKETLEFVEKKLKRKIKNEINL